MRLWIALGSLLLAAPAHETSRSPHFRVEWREGKASGAEAARVIARAEGAYRRYVELLGPARVHRQKYTIELEGDAAPGQSPTVSLKDGVLHLFRYPGKSGGYDASVTHELVHAIRWPRWARPNHHGDVELFIEEGFAEQLATEAGFPSLGFPTYGFDVDVVAGSWIGTDGELPLGDLVKHHRELNARCFGQAYGLRISFFRYLRERFGLAALIRLAYVAAPDAGVFQRVLGVPLTDLAAGWRAWAQMRFQAIPNGPALAQQYREKTPIRYFRVCHPTP